MIIIFYIKSSQAQHGNVWALGYKRGLNFNTNPVSLINTAIVQDTSEIDFNGRNWSTEISVSYSDCQGNLIAYGSNKQLWNKYHKPLKNGYFINSAYTGVLLIPKPKNPRYLYFFYHVQGGGSGYNCWNSRKLLYAILDLDGDNGAGEVIEKDKLVGSGGSASFTYSKHSNNSDIWIIHGSTDKLTNCYLLTDTGLNTNPVVNNNVYSDNNCNLGTQGSNYHTNNVNDAPMAYTFKVTRDCII